MQDTLRKLGCHFGEFCHKRPKLLAVLVSLPVIGALFGATAEAASIDGIDTLPVSPTNEEASLQPTALDVIRNSLSSYGRIIDSNLLEESGRGIYAELDTRLETAGLEPDQVSMADWYREMRHEATQHFLALHGGISEQAFSSILEGSSSQSDICMAGSGYGENAADLFLQYYTADGGTENVSPQQIQNFFLLHELSHCVHMMEAGGADAL